MVVVSGAKTASFAASEGGTTSVLAIGGTGNVFSASFKNLSTTTTSALVSGGMAWLIMFGFGGTVGGHTVSTSAPTSTTLGISGNISGPGNSSSPIMPFLSAANERHVTHARVLAMGLGVWMLW